MENREITLADIFLDILSESQDKGAKLMAERIKAAIKSPEILELVNICVINALGYKSKIIIIHRKKVQRPIIKRKVQHHK